MVKLIRLIIILFIAKPIFGQSVKETSIRLKDAILQAETNYHQLQILRFETQAASRNIEIVSYSKLPTVEGTYQLGLATANNVSGMFYPNGILPITGPPSSSNSFTPSIGSAAGLLLNWEVFTSGHRNAKISEAEAEFKIKEVGYKQALLEHKIKVISAYLDVVLSYDFIRIYEANKERTRVNFNQSQVLSRNGIKPKADSALFFSEFSKASADLLNTRRQHKVFQLTLAHLISSDDLLIPVDTAFVRTLPPISPSEEKPENNPTIELAEKELQLNQLKEKVISKSYLPKLNLWSTAFGRASGYQADGSINTIDGLSLNRLNYGIGLQLSVPISKHIEAKRQMQRQQLLVSAAKEKVSQSKSILETQLHIADETLSASLSMADEIENQLKSARYAFSAIQNRYNSGLVNFSDLIQAQYNLLKAELDNKKAHWDAWKALLLQAAIKGDEAIFTNSIR